MVCTAAGAIPPPMGRSRMARTGAVNVPRSTGGSIPPGPPRRRSSVWSGCAAWFVPEGRRFKSDRWRHCRVAISTGGAPASGKGAAGSSPATASMRTQHDWMVHRPTSRGCRFGVLPVCAPGPRRPRHGTHPGERWRDGSTPSDGSIWRWHVVCRKALLAVQVLKR